MASREDKAPSGEFLDAVRERALKERAQRHLAEQALKVRAGELVAKDEVIAEWSGHADSTGSKHRNMQLGMERAESVKLYLYDQHNVPLHKMNVLSFGEDRPMAQNDTPEGRAQNRRVVIRVRS